MDFAGKKNTHSTNYFTYFAFRAELPGMVHEANTLFHMQIYYREFVFFCLSEKQTFPSLIIICEIGYPVSMVHFTISSVMFSNMNECKI